ncbi:MAG: NAD-dependent epimerase/dehydratase family protein [Vicinamibacterales bacterium]
MTAYRDRRVVVGGGCGFLGSYLVPRLVDAGARVTVVDNLAHGDVPAGVLPAGVPVIRADLRDRAVCDEVLAGQDLFINLAATAAGVGFSRTHHGDMLVDNVLCGLVPLQAAVAHRLPHVVMTSTSCVYPDDAPVPTPELDAFTGLPERVNEGYGWAKRIQELAARYYAQDHGMRMTILRPFNMYGARYPWRSAEKAHVIPSLVKRMLDGEDPLVVWGSGEQRRNFLHGSDAAELVARVVAAGAEGPVNIGYEDDTRIADLVALICEVTGRRPRVVYDRSKPDGQPRKAADATRLRSLTGGFEPRVSLRQGIEEMVAWYHRVFA